MLVKRSNGELVLIKQVDHAEMTREIAEHWGNERFAAPNPQDEAFTAAAKHDDGWREPDAVPLFNDQERRPLHFLEIGMTEHAELYGRGVEEVFEANSYAGMLVSMHWTGLYRSRWGMQEGRVPFSDNVVRIQDEVVQAEEQRWIGVKSSLLENTRRSDLEYSLWYNYELLQAWDFVSLYACICDTSPGNGPTRTVFETVKGLEHEPGARTIPAVPTSIGGDRVELTMTAIDHGVTAIEPYPFDVDELRLTVPAKMIPDRPYADVADVRRALASARDETVACTFVRR